MVDEGMPLIANRVIRSATAKLPDNTMDTSDLDMIFLMYGIYDAPGRVNHHDLDSPTALPPLQFIEFVLRKHLRVLCADDAFNPGRFTYNLLFRTPFLGERSVFYEYVKAGPQLVVAAFTPPAYPYYARVFP